MFQSKHTMEMKAMLLIPERNPLFIYYFKAHLERMYGVVTDLYIDKFKLNGHNAKSRVPQLMAILDNYSLPSLLAFFAQPLTS